MRRSGEVRDAGVDLLPMVPIPGMHPDGRLRDFCVTFVFRIHIVILIIRAKINCKSKRYTRGGLILDSKVLCALF